MFDKQEHVVLANHEMTSPFPHQGECTIMFEKGHVMPEMLSPLPVWSPHEEEQMIVFETEMITPICLFPLVLPVASISVDGIASHDNDDLATNAVPILLDAAPITLDAKEGTLGFGEDALLGPNTAPDDPSIHLHPYDAPIPLVSHHAFHNTVDMLAPAMGLPVSHLHVWQAVMDITDHAVALPTSC